MTATSLDIDALAMRAASSIDERALRDILVRLCARPSPSGQERALAEDLAVFGRREHRDLEWDVDALDAKSANLVVRSSLGNAPELALYGHLDTSLTGEASRDAWITGETSEPPPFAEDGDALRGFGIGVAKAPSVAPVHARTGAVAPP